MQMDWQETRRQFPSRWVLVEAIRAHSEEGRRIVEDLAVIEAFDDSLAAWKGYTKMHRREPDREVFICHTSRESLEIEERAWLGIRTA